MPGSAEHGTDAERLLHSLMENVPGTIYRAANDSNWTNQRVSDEIETITGYPASDFLGPKKRTITSVTHPDDRGPVEREIAAALAADRPFSLEYRIMHADGRTRWVLERGVKTVDCYGVEWLDGIIFDISEPHAAEELRIERELEALHVTELEASRARIVAAGDDTRRRIERDLHDGAQQRLVVAALAMRAAERAAEPDGEVSGLLQEARAELSAGLAELRELARGIHPTVLTDRGLGPAVQALAARCAVPVEVDDTVGERLPAAVETALYHAVSEGLTNVDRHAAATHATVCLRRDGEFAEVAIADDGAGGADRALGTGLRGLEDRLATVGGVLELDSPAAAGTRLRARVRALTSGFVAGFDPLRAVERELVLVGAGLRRDGLEQEGVVVAAVGAPEDAADEPVRAGVEERHPARSLVPRAARGLVDLVPGLAAEELRQRLRIRRDAVDAEQLRVPAATVRAVVVRQADDEPRRIDAHLGGEADQAAQRLLVRAGRDDEHRVLQVTDERAERGATSTAATLGKPGRRRMRPLTLSAPDLLGDLDDQPQLGGLLLACQLVALDGRGEAALRRQAELVEVDVP